MPFQLFFGRLEDCQEYLVHRFIFFILRSGRQAIALQGKGGLNICDRYAATLQTIALVLGRDTDNNDGAILPIMKDAADILRI